MKAAIYNPYLDTLGGGERYAMAVVSVLLKNNCHVDVQWSDKNIIEKLENRFSIDLKGVNIVDDIKRGDSYDICFWVSDGSIPLLKARNNILHFQVPFKDVNGGSLMNRMKLYRVNKIVCNSEFTKNIIDKEYKVKSVVIYPPVAVTKFKPKRKENNILYVGRFSQLTQAKKQEILVGIFKEMYDLGQLKDWKLILAGGIEVGVDDYISNLRYLSEGYPISIIQSPSFNMLKELYGAAKIFWSASGYGIDENTEPERVEHFGISLVEAMAAGAVPVVYNAGGPKEVISTGINGYLWSVNSQLISITQGLIKDKNLLKTVSLKAIKDSKLYGYERFNSEIEHLL